MISTKLLQAHMQGVDVSSYAFHFDLTWVEPIINSNAWMTRSERLMLFTLIFCLRPKHYLEIGTFEGGSARIVCSALDALRCEGTIWLVDAAPQLSDETLKTIGHRTKVIRGKSPEVLPLVAHESGRQFDFVLLDGDHSYDGCLQDALGVFPHVTIGGYLLFHDAFFHEVRAAIDDFADRFSDHLIDFGLLTRETMVSHADDGRKVSWGGFRMMLKTSDPSFSDTKK